MCRDKAIGEPAQIRIFDVFDDLVKSGEGMPEDEYGEAQLLKRGQVFPVPLNDLQPFFASKLFEPRQRFSSLHIWLPPQRSCVIFFPVFLRS